MKGQSHTASLVEAATNIAVGVGINLVANIFVFHYYGWSMSLKQNVTITVFYTVISLWRSFLLRRLFNRFTYTR